MTRLHIGTRALLLRGVGAALLMAGLGLAAITERALLLHHQAAARHGGDVVLVDPAGAGAVPRSGMVLVSGTPEVVQAPRDPDFNLSVAAPRLTRRVEMFQWREVHVGEDVHYELDWSDQLQDSARFEEPRGHANPAVFPLPSRDFDAGLVKVGGFALGLPLLHALPGSAPVSPDSARLPANLAASFGIDGKYLTTSANPRSPRLGDVRVSWQTVPPQPVTILALLEGGRLLPARGADDGLGYEVQVGVRSLADVLPDVPEPPESTPARRGGAVLLAVLGALLLLWERRRRAGDALLAFGIGLTAVGAVSCASRLGGAWPPVLAWLAITACGVLLVVVLYRRMERPRRA